LKQKIKVRKTLTVSIEMIDLELLKPRIKVRETLNC
jgi:hypothetical protein